jgi:anti-anti-sigma factor
MTEDGGEQERHASANQACLGSIAAGWVSVGPRRWDAMSDLLLEIDVRSINAETVDVGLAGELDLASADELTARLEALAENHQDIVLDLSDLAFVDSTGLEVFVIIHKLLQNRGGMLTLRHPRLNVAKVIDLSGLSKVMLVERESANY